jgi:hypothetical protein
MALEFRQRLNRTFSTRALDLVRDGSTKGAKALRFSEVDLEAQPFHRRHPHSISRQVLAAQSRSNADRVGVRSPHEERGK